MSSKTKEEKDDIKILNRIRILVDPNLTPKPKCQTTHEELVLLCKKLTGVNY